jgi:hypothetical protein
MASMKVKGFGSIERGEVMTLAQSKACLLAKLFGRKAFPFSLSSDQHTFNVYLCLLSGLVRRDPLADQLAVL